MLAVTLAGILLGLYVILRLPQVERLRSCLDSAQRAGDSAAPINRVGAADWGSERETNGTEGQRGGAASHFLARRARRREQDDDLIAIPAMIHEMASLLAAGRQPQQFWSDLQRVAHERRATLGSHAHLWGEAGKVFAVCARHVEAGVSASIPLQQGGLVDTLVSGKPELVTVFSQLGTCIRVSELSGAPLSKVLGRFAEQLEQELEAEGARRTALAGPKATVTMLRWLPLFGLVLGALAGADPVQVFLGSGLGVVLLGIGGTLMFVGSLWSRKLVHQAEVRV